MAGMVVLALGLIGASAALTTGTILLNVENHRRTAVEIASCRQEQLRTASFEDLPSLGEEEHAVEIDALAGNRHTTIEGVDEDEDGAVDYYKVIVQVNWTENGRDQEVELTTLRSRYR